MVSQAPLCFLLVSLCSQIYAFKTPERELLQAMDEALGHLHGKDARHLSEIEGELRHTYRSMPRNHKDRIELPSLRYIVHRYFLQKYGIALKGFEPHRVANDTKLAAAREFRERLPAYFNGILHGSFAQDGFALKDVVAMIAALDHMVVEGNQKVLDESYIAILMRDSTEGDIEERYLARILRNYLAQLIYAERLPVDWNNFRTLETSVENTVAEVIGRLRYEVLRSRTRNPFQKGISFNEVAQAAEWMTRQSHNDLLQCGTLKKHLVSLDKAGTGRVKLADFYWSGSASSFAFEESKTYLQTLGVLDESSTWLGPQVLVANYVGGASNCIFDTQMYRVCCPSECESFLSRIESGIDKHTATPREIIELVDSDPFFQEVEDAQNVSKSLTAKLQSIAEHHQGTVPLHGRLFAQWLHYYRPRECPFPHVRGAVEAKMTSECGLDCFVTTEDMEEITSKVAEGELHDANDANSEIWLSQWSHEEDLILSSHGARHGAGVPERSWAFWPLVLFAIGLLVKLAHLNAEERRALLKGLPTPAPQQHV